MLWSGIWLIFLISAFHAAWRLPQPLHRVVGVTVLVLFAASYLVGLVVVRAPAYSAAGAGSLVRWVAFGVAATLLAVVLAVVGEGSTAACVYVAVLAVFTLPAIAAWVSVCLICGVVLVLGWVVPGWSPDPELAFVIFVSAFASWGITRMIERNRQLAAAREEIASLAVSAERSRFARDLHDLLGHSLTVVAVKAELAGRLVSLDPGRAISEITDIERLAREALADVRSAVTGYREVSLVTELVTARCALDAAGIEADLPSAVDHVPASLRELFGWSVREGVTNIVRHSGARRCRVRCGPRDIEITDDGCGPTSVAGQDGHGGHGLESLRERATAAGGMLTVGRCVEGGFALTLRVP